MDPAMMQQLLARFGGAPGLARFGMDGAGQGGAPGLGGYQLQPYGFTPAVQPGPTKPVMPGNPTFVDPMRAPAMAPRPYQVRPGLTGFNGGGNGGGRQVGRGGPMGGGMAHAVGGHQMTSGRGLL
jgi:hypothetical protein